MSDQTIEVGYTDPSREEKLWRDCLNWLKQHRKQKSDVGYLDDGTDPIGMIRAYGQERYRRGLETWLSDECLEAMAAVEHERWAAWYRWQRDNSTLGGILWWNKQAATPYAELSEIDKEKDRREVIRILGAARQLFAEQEEKGFWLDGGALTTV